MKDDKLCISPDALIAMIVTEAQDRALAQMPGPEAPLGEVQASDAFLRRMRWSILPTAGRIGSMDGWRSSGSWLLWPRCCLCFPARCCP